MTPAAAKRWAAPSPPLFRNPAARLEAWLWWEQTPPGDVRPRHPAGARAWRASGDVEGGPQPRGDDAAGTPGPPRALPTPLRAAQE